MPPWRPAPLLINFSISNLRTTRIIIGFRGYCDVLIYSSVYISIRVLSRIANVFPTKWFSFQWLNIINTRSYKKNSLRKFFYSHAKISQLFKTTLCSNPFSKELNKCYFQTKKPAPPGNRVRDSGGSPTS